MKYYSLFKCPSGLPRPVIIKGRSGQGVGSFLKSPHMQNPLNILQESFAPANSIVPERPLDVPGRTLPPLGRPPAVPPSGSAQNYHQEASRPAARSPGVQYRYFGKISEPLNSETTFCLLFFSPHTVYFVILLKCQHQI